MRSLLSGLRLVQDVAWVTQLQHAGSNTFSNLLNTTAREGKVIGGVIEHLFAMIVPVAQDDAPLAVDQDTVGPVELPAATAITANGPNVGSVAVKGSTCTR
jgi:hypothetical protein